MADQPASDRTEQATPERLRKARTEGQLPTSQEVGSAMVMIAVVISLAMIGPSLLAWSAESVRQAMTAVAGDHEAGDSFLELLRARSTSAMYMAVPMLIVLAVVSAFSTVVVSGLSFSPKALKWDLSKVSPVKGFKNLFSLQSLARLGFSLVKLTTMGVICYLYIRSHREELLLMIWTTPAMALHDGAGLVLGLLVRVCICLGVIAGIDYAFQKWSYARRMRMTKQEVKEERKQYEASPEVRMKIRAIQREFANKRMLADVPNADVVIANPTHYAVALKYDQKTMDAPMVLAKGPDELALKIKDIARNAGVPIIERPVLARALYASAEVGKAIPSQMFVAVAEVLAMIFRMKRNRKKAKK